MALELNKKTTKRPKLQDLEIGDVLHVGSGGKEIFAVQKLGENNYAMYQGDEIRFYGRAVMNKNIQSFTERYPAVFWITHPENEDEEKEKQTQNQS